MRTLSQLVLPAVTLAAVATAVPAAAQTAPGRIRGTAVAVTGGAPIAGVTVTLSPADVGAAGAPRTATSNARGEFSFFDVAPGRYVLQTRAIGYRVSGADVTVTSGTEVTPRFQLRRDELLLEQVVVTGTANPRTQIESSVAITAITTEDIEQRNPRGTGDLLQAVPGTYVDNSFGEVENRVSPRGLPSGSGTDESGYRYVSLQEDGLPLMSSLIRFITIDQLFRQDATIDRFEAVRGGTSAVSATNSPGGVYNFISRRGTDQLAGVLQLRGGLQGESNSLYRVDGNVSGPIAGGLTYSLGGFYRTDEGAREVPFTANEGGQVKGNLVKSFGRGYVMAYGKYLDDRVTTFRTLPFLYTDTSGTTFGGLRQFTLAGRGTGADLLRPFDLNYSTTQMDIRTQAPDARRVLRDRTARRDYNSTGGIDVDNRAGGLLAEFTLPGDVRLQNNFKFSRTRQTYNGMTGQAVFPTANIGLIFSQPTLTSPQIFGPDGQRLAAYANGQFVPGSGPGVGNLIYLTAPLDLQNYVTDGMNQLTLGRRFGAHDVTLGGFAANANFDVHYDVDFIVSTFEPNPRRLRITHPSSPLPGAPQFQLSDTNGFIGYNAAAYVEAPSRAKTQAVFLNDVWQATSRVNVDAGLRYEWLTHTGRKEAWQFVRNTALPPAQRRTGPDGNPLTLYDAGLRAGRDTFFSFDQQYDYLSASLGVNYSLTDRAALYARATRGNKAPDLEWYVNNFVNAPIQRGYEETVEQGELGVKLNSERGALTATGFYSRLSDIPFQVYIPTEATTFFTPATLNTSRTVGIEIEGVLRPFSNFTLRGTTTLQDPKYTKFEFYNVNNTNPAPDEATGRIGPNPFLVREDLSTPVPRCDGRSASDRFTPQPSVGPSPAAPLGRTDCSDDYYEDFEGNRVDNVPRLIVDLTPAYEFRGMNVYVNARYTGERWVNKRNAFALPGYTVLGAGVQATLLNRYTLTVQGNNLANSDAIVALDPVGLGLLGSNIENVDRALAQQHLAGQTAFGRLSGGPLPLWGRPLLPRNFSVQLGYAF